MFVASAIYFYNNFYDSDLTEITFENIQKVRFILECV